MSDNREFIEEFLVEAGENLDQLDRDLIALEERPDDPQRLASIFRTVHTIKGNSGFFGFSKLGALTHSGEHLLGRLRDGKIRLNDRVTGTLYSMVDAVRSILHAIEETGVEGEQDFRELSQTLAAVAAEDSSAAEPEVATPAPSAAAPPPSAPQTAPPVPVAPTPEAIAPSTAPFSSPQPPPSTAPAKPASPSSDTSIRVDVGLLASILDLVGELVLARNELRSIESTDPVLEGVIHRINTVTNSLQEAAVKTRMQPIEHVFNKFPRTVRDLAVACGREVQLVIDGADTELDRTLIESIRDPLTHLIRNAVDHGIEAPAVRESAGKPRAGQLLLRAFHESGPVTIEVQDDGAGSPVEAVRAKAVARGLIDADNAALLPDDRVLQFIFEPGFSTAAQVTSVSGRGVGMDVVKTNIEAIGGTVDISSRPGLGTTVRVRVPLTLAIIPALVVLVRVDDHEFGLVVDGTQTDAIARDSLPGRDGQSLTSPEAASLSTIVVKPIGSMLAQLGIYSGATVLGDGGVVLILDLRGILRMTQLPQQQRHCEEAGAVSVCAADSYLVCRTGTGRRIAVPLDTVVRLEQFDGHEVQAVGGRRLVRRGDLFTPVIDADSLLGGAAAQEDAAAVNLVVLDDRCGGIGIAVHQILDVAAADSVLQPSLAAPGVAGTLAVGGIATEVIDLAAFLTSVGASS